MRSIGISRDIPEEHPLLKSRFSGTQKSGCYSAGILCALFRSIICPRSFATKARLSAFSWGILNPIRSICLYVPVLGWVIFCIEGCFLSSKDQDSQEPASPKRPAQDLQEEPRRENALLEVHSPETRAHQPTSKDKVVEQHRCGKNPLVDFMKHDKDVASLEQAEKVNSAFLPSSLLKETNFSKKTSTRESIAKLDSLPRGGLERTTNKRKSSSEVFARKKSRKIIQEKDLSTGPEPFSKRAQRPPSQKVASSNDLPDPLKLSRKKCSIIKGKRGNAPEIAPWYEVYLSEFFYSDEPILQVAKIGFALHCFQTIFSSKPNKIETMFEDRYPVHLLDGFYRALSIRGISKLPMSRKVPAFFCTYALFRFLDDCHGSFFMEKEHVQSLDSTILSLCYALFYAYTLGKAASEVRRISKLP